MKSYFFLLLFLQVITSSCIFFAIKIVDVKKANGLRVLIINYIVAVVASFLAIDSSTGFTLSEGREIWKMWPALVIGFLFMFNYLLMIHSTQRIGVGLTSAFSKMSVIIPVLVGILFLGQTNNLIIKCFGIVLTLISFYLVLYTKNKSGIADKDKGPKMAANIILPLSVFLFSGVCDELQELVRKFLIFTTNDLNIFLFIVFATAMICSVILAIIDVVRHGLVLSWWTLICGVFLGLSNFFTSKLLLINVNIFGGSIVFPIINTSTVLITSLLGMLLFKEKLTVRQWIGIGAAMLSVVLIALAI